MMNGSKHRIGLTLAVSLAVVFVIGVSTDVEAETVSLDQVLEEVPERHETQEITEMEIRQSEALRRQALAALLPQLDISAGVSRQGGEQVVVDEEAAGQRYGWNVGAAAGVTIFNGPLYFDYWQSGALVDATSARAQWERHLLELDAEVAFFTLASAQREVEIAEAAIEWRQDYVDQAQALLDAGMALSVDVSRAQTAVLEAQQALLEAEMVLGNAADSLATLMGREPDGELRADYNPEEPIEEFPDELADTDLSRPDFAARRHNIEAAELGRRGIWWSLLPRLNFGINADWRRSTSFSFNPDGSSWSMMLSATWNLYDGGARYARADGAQAEVRQLELELERDLRDADVGLAQALRQWRSAANAIDVAEEQVELADDVFDQMLAQFEAGLVNSLEVSDASQELLNAELRLNQVRLEARLAEVRYRYLEIEEEE